MSTTIKPTFVAPVVHGHIVGPAAPTPAEHLLRGDFALLESRLQEVETRLRNELAAKEEELLRNMLSLRQNTIFVLTEAHHRLDALEAGWYARIVKFFREVRSWL